VSIGGGHSRSDEIAQACVLDGGAGDGDLIAKHLEPVDRGGVVLVLLVDDRDYDVGIEEEPLGRLVRHSSYASERTSAARRSGPPETLSRPDFGSICTPRTACVTRSSVSITFSRTAAIVAPRDSPRLAAR